MAAAGYPEINDPEACFKLRDRWLSFGKISLRDAVRDVPADKPAAACSVYRFFVGRGDIAAAAEGKSPLYAVERRVRQQRCEQIGISRAVGGAELYAPPAARFRQADRLRTFSPLSSGATSMQPALSKGLVVLLPSASISNR